ncbi:hypothetical protein [Natronomonas marina]|jgi:hypothetical protein|uniref:hypothetical protein n=1 Tax=Natronomonas marina TaxID=2961939 RepID=UPI0020C9C60A|nr:hypothetical protein [Natronomonas marina]
MADEEGEEGASTAESTVSESPTRPDGPDAPPAPRLASRVFVTWIELTLVGLVGGLAADAVGGPPGFVVYLAATLLAVGVLFYNVNELLERRLRAAGVPE